jgi:oligoendopeptidase F
LHPNKNGHALYLQEGFPAFLFLINRPVIIKQKYSPHLNLGDTMSDPTVLPSRAEVPVRYQWNAESVFATPAEWDTTAQEVESDLLGAKLFQGQLKLGAEQLIKWFTYQEKVQTKLGKLLVYAMLSYSVDMQDQVAMARMGRVRSLFARAQAEMSFGDPEIIQIGFDTLHKWMAENEKLAVFRHYFDRLETSQEHTRSAEVEEVLGLVMDPFRSAASIHSTLTDSDLKFFPAADPLGQEHEIAQSTIGALLTHSNREVRKTAWENYADGYLSVKNGLANCLATGVKQDVFNVHARKYSSSLEASLSPNHIPVEVFHNLIDTFRKNLPTWHRYWRLRRKALGYEKLHAYDIKAPLVTEEVTISFEQAVDWISEGMAPLGEEYVQVLRRGVLEQRWVDSAVNRGKRSGAFSSGSPGTYPFIMMSFNNDIFGLSTLAHELGHSLHSYFAWQTQPFVYSRYSLFVAEVASNFNQALVRAHLLKTKTERNLQIAIIEEAMSNFHRYLFIMPTLARLELDIHEQVEKGKTLTADGLISQMADLFAEGYGGEVEQDRERIGITWGQFPNHLYANFYVYQYATGIAGANALAQAVLSQETGAQERYLNFLRTGGAAYPLDALRAAGVDLTRPEPVQKTYDLLLEMVERLESLLF